MSGWGNLFGKIADQFQGRIERLKNEKKRLLDERENLISQPSTDTSRTRVLTIDSRLREINTALEVKASD